MCNPLGIRGVWDPIPRLSTWFRKLGDLKIRPPTVFLPYDIFTNFGFEQKFRYLISNFLNIHTM